MITTATLAHRLWPAATSTLGRDAVLAVAGSLLIAGAANVTVPMWPVPMTLQTLAVLMVGGAFGARLGLITVVLYLIEGMIGLPFFAEGKSGLFGADGILIPSGGYLIGFMVAAWLAGRLAQIGWINSPARMISASVLGGAVLYVPGLIWLAVWAARTQGMDAATAVSSALSWGLYPFIMGDVIKAVIAGIALPLAWNGSASKS